MVTRVRPAAEVRNVHTVPPPVPPSDVVSLDSVFMVLALGGDVSGGDVLVAAAVLALLLTAWQVRLAIIGQQRAAQPVVIAHEHGHDISNRGELEFMIWIENHGIAGAFNVRFGVELAGRRYPFGLDDDSDRGARQVVGPGDRLPPDEGKALPLRVPWTFYKGAEPNESVIPRRVFWARYENPFGETWETLTRRIPVETSRSVEYGAGCSRGSSGASVAAVVRTRRLRLRPRAPRHFTHMCSSYLSLADLFTAGLGFDVAGAGLIAYGLFLSPQGIAIRTTAWLGYNAEEAVALARGRVDAISGFLALGIGFICQGVAYAAVAAGADTASRTGWRAAVGAAVAALAAAALAVGLWYAVRDRMVKRLLIEVARWNRTKEPRPSLSRLTNYAYALG
jgi:hypothetical protein